MIAALHSFTFGGFLLPLVTAAVIIWLLFFVLPLPPFLRTAFAIIVAVALLFMLTGCATNTGDPQRDRRGRVTNAVLGEAFNAVVKVGLSAGANALAGRNGQDAAAGIFDNVGSIDGAGAIAHVLHAYAGPEIAPVAAVAAQQFQQIAPKTDAERALVTNTIGAAVQLAANQLAK